MINKLYTWAAGLLLAALGFLGVYFSGKRSGRAAQKEKGAQATRDVEKKVNETIRDRLEKEGQAVEEAKRRRFSFKHLTK